MNYKLRITAVKKLKGSMGITNSMAFLLIKKMCNAAKQC